MDTTETTRMTSTRFQARTEMMDRTGRVPVADLLAAASAGDRTAWDQLVQRYIPLVYSVVRRFRLCEQDAADVSQTLWLRLVENLGDIREPAALPGWIIATTKNEALRVVRARSRVVPVDPTLEFEFTPSDSPETHQGLLQQERHQALRDGLAELSERDRDLLLLLISDPPIPYIEVSRRLGIPVGSIGPTRARCLRRLRAIPAIADLLGAEQTSTGPSGNRGCRAG